MKASKWFFFAGALCGIVYANLSHYLNWPWWADVGLCLVVYWGLYYTAYGLAALWQRGHVSGR